jgi:hypothetical protein
MKLARTLLALSALVAAAYAAGCNDSYDDRGEPNPASWWPWVCDDGGPAPESGCLSASEDAGSPDGDASATSD